MTKSRFLPFLTVLKGLGHFFGPGDKITMKVHQTRKNFRDRRGGGRPPTRHLAFFGPPKKGSQKWPFLAIFTCMDFNCQNGKIIRFRRASKINFSRKLVKKRVQKNGPKMDPSKKSDFATNFFGISPAGPKSSILTFFSDFFQISTFWPIFWPFLHFPSSNKVKNRAKSGQKRSFFEHFWPSFSNR